MWSGRISRARQLRREQTEAELRLWNCLRNRGLGGYRWKRQVPFAPYYLDFLCPDLGLVVELDGGQHSAAEAEDGKRTAVLESRGLRVMRFWNYEVIEDLDAVCATIPSVCKRMKP